MNANSGVHVKFRRQQDRAVNPLRSQSFSYVSFALALLGCTPPTTTPPPTIATVATVAAVAPPAPAASVAAAVAPPAPAEGRLAPEVIQKIVRENFGALRLCYEEGLRKDPELKGRVTIRFAIDRDGTVTDVGDSDSVSDPSASGTPGSKGIPDPAVSACVVAEFRKLVFPHPEGGIVTVVYPIMFSPES